MNETHKIEVVYLIPFFYLTYHSNLFSNFVVVDRVAIFLLRLKVDPNVKLITNLKRVYLHCAALAVYQETVTK